MQNDLSVFHRAGDVVELRALGKFKGAVQSGYFKDHAKLHEIISVLDKTGEHKGIYFILNEINPALYARRPDSISLPREAIVTTSDEDITRRRWLPVDFDPVRPADISSTEEEHNAAIQRAKDVAESLKELGWPDPIIADSGNGAHLLYAIDTPNNSSITEQIEYALKALDAIYSDGTVKIDTKNFNAARIWKAYGTVSRKGANIPERPWRRSQILDLPTISVVNFDLVKSLAWSYREKERIEKYDRPNKNEIDLGQWLSSHGVDVAKTKTSHGGGTMYILSNCPWNSDHNDRSAWAVQFPSGAIAAGCHHNGCTGKGWRDLRSLFEPTYEKKAPKESYEPPREDFTEDNILDFCTECENAKGEMYLKFSPTASSNSIIHKYFTLAMEKGDTEIYWYDGKIYQPDGARKIDLKVCQVVEDRAEDKNVKEVVRRVKNILLENPVEFDPDPYLLGLKNGVADLRTGEVRPYTPEDLITDMIDVWYDPNARCPAFLNFLETSAPHVTDRFTLIDWMAATAIREPLPYVLFLLGLGRNGKGVYEKLLKRFFKESSFRDMKLDEPRKNNFAASEFYKKRGWIASETSGKKKSSIGTDFVKLVSGDGVIDNDRKNKSRIQFRPFFQTIVDTNAMPTIEDTSIGWIERFIKIDLPYIYVNNPDPENPLERKKDPDLYNKLTTDEELSGILNLVLWRATEISKTMSIHKRSSDEMFSEYTMQSSSVSTFCDAFCEYDEYAISIKQATDEIYSAYKKWCSYLVGEVVTEAYFGRYLKRFCGGRDSVRMKKEVEIDGEKKMVNCRAYPGLLFHDDLAKDVIKSIASGFSCISCRSPVDNQNNNTEIDHGLTVSPVSPVESWKYVLKRFGDNLYKDEYAKIPVLPAIPEKSTSDDVSEVEYTGEYTSFAGEIPENLNMMQVISEMERQGDAYHIETFELEWDLEDGEGAPILISRGWEERSPKMYYPPSRL